MSAAALVRGGAIVYGRLPAAISQINICAVKIGWERLLSVSRQCSFLSVLRLIALRTLRDLHAWETADMRLIESPSMHNVLAG